LIDTNTHIQACQKAVENWSKKKKKIGSFIYFGNVGFESIDKSDKVESSIIFGLNLENIKDEERN